MLESPLDALKKKSLDLLVAYKIDKVKKVKDERYMRDKASSKPYVPPAK